MIYVGTSGYSYDDWVGPFYPARTPKSAFLGLYAQRFSSVEVNYTYYRMPTAATLEAMAQKVGPTFRFVVKATGELTHERSGREEAFAEFRAALQPLVERGQLGGVLAQFPYSFKPTEATRAYLGVVREQLPDLAVIVEFRNSAWVNPRSFDLLRSLGLGYCCVDEPRLTGLMPPVAEVTAPPAYLRFHGRNAARWFEHDEAWERYNYLYTRDELADWAHKLRALASVGTEAYVFFNNHYNAQAVQNAGLFVELLHEADES